AALALAGCSGSEDWQPLEQTVDRCMGSGAVWNPDAKRCEVMLDGALWVQPTPDVILAAGSSCPSGWATSHDFSGYCVRPEVIARYEASRPAQYVQPVNPDATQQAQLRALREIAEQ